VPPSADDADPEQTAYESLESVTHGAVVNGTGSLAQRVLQFLVNFALTQALPVALYGVYSLGDRFVRILVRFAALGSDRSVVRFLPEYDDPGRRNRIVGIAYLTTAVASVALGVGLYLIAPAANAAMIDHPAFVGVLRLFAVMLPAFAFVRLIANLFRTLELVEYQTLLMRVGIPAARLLAVLVALLLGLSVFGVVGAIVLATTVLAALSFGLVLRRTDLRADRPTLSESAEFYNHSVPTAATQIGAVLRNRIDVLLIGFFLTADAAGIYNVALVLTGFIFLPLIAFNALLPAVASDLYTDGRHAALQSVYSIATRWVVTATLPIAVVVFVYRTELLALFGSAYTRGSLVLAVFVVGRVIGSAVGATGWLLLMTDHQYLRMVNSWGLGLLNVGASYYFIVEFGLVGAALGTASSLAFVNVLRLAQLWYLEDLQPYSREYVKPLAAGAAMAAVMIAVRPLFEGVVLLVVGSALGLAAFAAVLVGLGVEAGDRRVFGGLIEQYRPGGTVEISRRSD
jgi:O-antigen/teichoic acid export membrane protein